MDEAAADFFGDLCRRRTRTLGQFREGSLRAFLAISAANYARTRATRALRLRERAVTYQETAAEAAVLDTPRETHASDDRIRSALERCSASDRVLFRLLYVEGASTESACAFLGISRELLYLRKHRFHQRIRSLLEERSRGAAESPR